MARVFCAILMLMLCLSACRGETSLKEVKAVPSQVINSPQDGYLDSPVPQEDFAQTDRFSQAQSKEEGILKITVGEYVLNAAFEDNASAREFRQLLAQGPVTIEMDDYGGFEKVGALGTTLTRSDEQITAEPGDVILYQGNQITVYYGTNSWKFTRLAKIEDPSDLKAKLGEGTVQVTFSLEPGEDRNAD